MHRLVGNRAGRYTRGDARTTTLSSSVPTPGAVVVSPPERYTRSGEPVQQGPVSVVRALDPVTGLPVRLYRFPGQPLAGAEALRHAHVLRVLEAGHDDDGGYVVSHLVDGTSNVMERPALLDDAAAVAATAALAEAAHQGVVHGDLGPHRLHRRGEDVWLEGYGVPWADGSLDDDLRQFALALSGLHGHALSPAVRIALEAATTDDAGDAATFAASVAAAATAARRTPPSLVGTDASSRREPDARFDDVVLEVDDASETAEGDASGSAAAASVTPAPDASPGARAGAAPPSPRSARPDPPGAVTAPPAAADGAATPVPSTHDSGSFRKGPPPGVTYRTGETPVASSHGSSPHLHLPSNERTRRRRTWLLAALLVLAVVLAVVTAVARRPVPPPPGASGPLSSFVVEVRIEPTSLPPVSLVVIASPGGSRLGAGSVLGTVPRRVVFDAEGTWQVQGRFQDRRSETVTFRLPQDREIVLPFPDTP